MEAQMLRRFERLQETLADRSARIVRLSEEAQGFRGLLSNLTQMVTVTVGAVFVINGGMSVGTLACCVMLSGRAVQPLLRCVAVWNELQAVVVGLEKAEPLLQASCHSAYQAARTGRGATGCHLVRRQLELCRRQRAARQHFTAPARRIDDGSHGPGRQRKIDAGRRALRPARARQRCGVLQSRRPCGGRGRLQAKHQRRARLERVRARNHS